MGTCLDNHELVSQAGVFVCQRAQVVQNWYPLIGAHFGSNLAHIC